MKNGTIGIAFTAQISTDGKLFNKEKAEKPKTSAREYENLIVRFWDTYLPKEVSSLWYTVLEHTNGKYKLGAESEPINALADTELELPYFPVTFMSGGEYEISSTGLLIITAPPEVNPATGGSQGLWYLQLETFTEKSAKLRRIRNSNEEYKGAVTSASFSFDGRHIAYIQQDGERWPTKEDGIFMIDLSSSDLKSFPVPSTFDGVTLEPTSVIFSNDGKELYITAEFRARTVLFRQTYDFDQHKLGGDFALIHLEGSISAVHRLASSSSSNNHLFLTTSSFVDPSIYLILSPESQSPSAVISDQMKAGSVIGLHRKQVSEISITRAKKDGSKYSVQSFITVPSDFDKSKKYPICLLIHGGPSVVLNEAWSTRWNPATFAEQGYVVVNPNPTGSNSFGFEYMNAVNGEWGGDCYLDIEATFDHIEKTMPWADTSRAVLGGGSFGGYMTNWVAGQPLGARMKALFSHDGVFSLVNMISSDVPSFLDIEVGAHLWDDPEKWNQYTPSSYTKNWKTPMLVIHSDHDYRCPITEGLAVHNVCQMKGIESRFLNFPDENHFVLKHENSLQWYRTVLGWINKFTGVERGVKLQPALTRGPWKAPKSKEQIL